VTALASVVALVAALALDDGAPVCAGSPQPIARIAAATLARRITAAS
jgi:hypothetical protein